MKNGKENPLSQEVLPQKLILWSFIMAIAFGWIFWDFLQRQFWFAIEQQADWGHTLVIPFIAGYFVWLCKDKLLAQPFKRAWLGLAPIVLGLAWYSLCALGPTSMHHHNLMGLGVASTLSGLVLFIFGWRAMRYLWFPLLYLFVFGQTISDRFMEIVTFELQDIASIGSYYGLSFLGLDMTRAGNTLDIFFDGETYPLNIAEACSGMRMLMAFFALGVAMAFTGLKYFWQRAILVGLAIPTAVFVNILRVMTLGLLSIADSGFSSGDFHTFVGTLWLIPAFLIYLGIVWVLKNLIIEEEDVDEEPPQERTIRFTGSAFAGFFVAIVMLASSAVAFQVGANYLNVILHKEPVYPRKNFSVIPTKFLGWERTEDDARFDAAGVEALGTELYLSRIYSNINRSVPTLHLHIAYYTGQVDAVPHVPDRCMVAGGFVPLTPEPKTLPLNIDTTTWADDNSEELDGVPYPVVTDWNKLTEQEEIIRMPLGDFEIRITEFSHPQIGDDHFFAGYFFIANGKTTAYPERIRLLAFDRSSQFAYYCKLQFTLRGDSEFTVEKFVDIVSEFSKDLLPEVMRCLPDWAEVTSPLNETRALEN
jgi:exosortase